MANDQPLKYSRYVELVEILELPTGGYAEIADIKTRFATVIGALAASVPGSISHGDLANLLTDDHLQYILGDRTIYAHLIDGSSNVLHSHPTTSVVPVGADGLITGGQVVWNSLLIFTVSPATYRLAGVDYSSVLTALTLGAADATNPRIDVIAVNSSGVAVVIPGVAASSPAPPSVNPQTQIALSFIFVAALATTPTGITNTALYNENTEWTSSQTGANHTLASTNNPHAGTKDIEATSAIATNAVTLTKPAAGTELLTNYNNLIFYLRFKAAWPNAKSLSLAWFNGSTQIGNSVTVKGGLFNLDGANITTYQQVVIPLANFNALTAVTKLVITVVGSGAAIGYYIDDISIQGGVLSISIPSHIMIHRGVYNAAISYAIDDVVTTSAGATYIAVAASVGVTPGTDATKWKQIGDGATDAIEFVIDGNGAVITTGIKGDIEVPFACTIVGVTILLDQSGSIVIDIWKDTYANYPPVVGDSITAAAKPTVSGAVKSQDNTLTGWITAIIAGSTLRYNVDSIATATRATISLRVIRA